MNRLFAKVIVGLIFLALAGSYFYFDLHQYFSRDVIDLYFRENAVLTMAIYFLAYVVTAASSLPGAAALTLAGGAVFGFSKALFLVSFASSIGATLAFLSSRFLFREGVISLARRRGYHHKIDEINNGVERDGIQYLLALRLIPLFPFWFVNLVMGLTTMSTAKYYVISQIGMFPGTAAFVYAGIQLGKFSVSWELFLSFAVLGLLPLLSQRVVHYLRLRKFKRPEKSEYNLIVIGAGSAGLICSYLAATLKAKVALIEKNKMGGECLNTGCVPSKALLRTAKILSYFKEAKKYGLQSLSVDFAFSDVMKRVHEVIKKIEPHDSIERYTSLGVECIQGEARIKSPFVVEVNGRELTTKNIIIATGARPVVPEIPGLSSIDFLTSENVWELDELPKQLVIVGGGAIGCELAQAFSRLGSKVTIIESGNRLLSKEDEEVSQELEKKFSAEGIQVLTKHKITKVSSTDLTCENAVTVKFDRLLLALGRKANSENFGLESLGIEKTENGDLRVNNYLQTSIPNIFACGDVCGPFNFTHMAAHQAYYATVNSLFGFLKQTKVDYSVVPWCTYTDPMVARVGLNEQEAKRQNIPYEVTTFELNDLDRAITDSTDFGFIKVLTVPESDRILGATIVGAAADNLITEYILAMKHGFGLNKILNTIHIYPTMMEANKLIAGKWKKARVSERSLRFLAWLQTWRRG